MFAAGTPNPGKIASAQKASGATPLESVELQREIERNYELARAVGFSGTPTFVVGGKVLQGAVGYKVLKQAVDEARTRS
jgi:protein-disulfide isomerase